jgi:hypothetical protein
MSKVHSIQLSNYVRPEVKEQQSKEYVLNGDKNSFYKYIIDRYNGSPTNRAIIDSYSQFIYGKGLMSKQQAMKPIQFANVVRILSKKDLKAICHDYEMFNEASIECIYKKGELVRMKHVPKNYVLPNKLNDEGDIEQYWYSMDFNNPRKYPPIPFDNWKLNEIKDGSLIYVISDYQVGKIYFSDPAYMAGLPYAELEEEIANYCINHIKNGLSTGYVINMNNGVPNSEEEKSDIIRETKDNLTGSSNAGRILLMFNDNKENASTIEALEVSEAHKQYEFLSQESSQKIMISHRVTSPILFGIKDSTGLGNNANEMESAFNELMINVIQPKKEVILDALMEIFAREKILIDLDFIPLRTIVQPTQLAKQEHHTDDILADALIDLGEEIDESEWELIDERVQDGIPELNEISLSLAYVPSNFPERESKQDTALFKIRYSYEGSQSPERDFCRKMVGAKKVYRKEDIDAASKKAVNKGFGPYGTDTYDLFLYKGGARCQHFWMRKIYLKSNNDQISSKKARELLNELDPSIRKEANFEQNDPLVAKMPTDMPNQGFLTAR